MVLHISDNLKNAFDNQTIKPALIAEVIVGHLSDEVNTRSDWDRCILTNIDTTSFLRSAVLSKETTTYDIDNSGTDESEYKIGYITLPYLQAVAAKILWTALTAKIHKIYFGCESDHDNRTTWFSIHKNSPYSTGETIYSVLITDIDSADTYREHTLEDVSFETGNTYYLMWRFDSSIGGTYTGGLPTANYIYIKTDDTHASSYPLVLFNKDNDGVESSTEHPLIKIMTDKYSSTGSIVADLDLEETPTANGSWELSYTEPKGTAIEFTAIGSNNADFSSPTNLGTIEDGKTITDLHRYYRVTVNLTASNSLYESPRVDLIRCNLNVSKKYTYNENILFDYPNVISDVSNMKISLDAHGYVTKVSGLTLDILDIDEELSDTLKDNVIYDKKVFLKFGLDDSNVNEHDFMPAGTYLVTDYSYNSYNKTIRLECDNILSKIDDKNKYPTDSEFEIGLGNTYNYGNSAWTGGTNDIYNPPMIIKDLLQNKLNLSDTLIDSQSFIDVATLTTISGAINCKRNITKAESAKGWITELCQLCWSYLCVNEKGIVSLINYDESKDPEAYLTEDDIIDNTFKLSSPIDNLYNRVQVRFGYNYDDNHTGDKYEDWQGTVFTANVDSYDSYTLHNNTYYDYKAIKSLWLGPDKNEEYPDVDDYSGLNAAETIADVYFDRYKWGAPQVDFQTRLDNYPIQVGDIITISHPSYIGYGVKELYKGKFFVLEKNVDFNKAIIKWKAIRAKTSDVTDVTYGFTNKSEFYNITESDNLDLNISSLGIHLEPNSSEQGYLKFNYTLDNASDFGGILTISGTQTNTAPLIKWWVSNYSTNEIFKCTISGTKDEVVSTTSLDNNFTEPWGMTQDWDGTLWVANKVTTSGTACFYNLDPTEGYTIKKRLLTYDMYGLIHPESITVAADGNLWVTNTFTGNYLIKEITKNGGVLTTISASTWGGSRPDGIAYDMSDDTLWICDQTDDKIYHINTDGSLIASFDKSIFDTNAVSMSDIDCDVAGDNLSVVDYSTDKVYQLDALDCTLVRSFDTSDVDPSIDTPTGMAMEKSLTTPDTNMYTCEIWGSTDSGETYTDNLGTFDNLDVIPGGYTDYQIYFLILPNTDNWQNVYFNISVEYPYG